ncbi:hypothetical protein B0H10DRAFT_2193725 [Mycena sp. CBHHK59/15]|nr:hypothetical protein B0H10DRAFT_2193725 [Mycena sp. CBHHK59/15]
MAASKHTPADRDFLDGLSGRQLTEFRNYMYTPAYITSNAGRFLDQEWIDVPTLNQFLGRNAPDRPTPTRSVKAEPQSVVIPRKTATSVKIRTSYEGSREVLELSSDSEAHVADDSDIEVSEELTRAVSRSSSVFPPPARLSTQMVNLAPPNEQCLVPQVYFLRRRISMLIILMANLMPPNPSHKEINEWIIPCLVKSQSRIPADVWDSTPSTANTNEAQHHWTNSQTGIKLTCVEAIESAYVVDQKTADEIQMSMRTGILTNAHNEVAHRMARNWQHQSNTAQRARESRQQIEERRLLEEQLPEELEARRQSSARTKDINAQLKVVKSSSKKGRTSSSSAILSASSSGRVKTATGKSARKTSSGSGQGANPSNPVIIEAPEPAGPAPSAFNSFELGWDSMFPAAVPAFTSVDGMRSQALKMSEANFIEPATADFLNPELYSAALTMYPDAVAPPPALDLPYDLIAADLNSFFGFDSGFSSDIPSTAPADIAYANSSESPLAETFFDTAFNFYSTSFASPLPSLPPPPAESPCGSSPAPENLTPDMPPSHLTRARRSRLDGLEPTNIPAPGSSRSRAPSSRKRDAEENISE